MYILAAFTARVYHLDVILKTNLLVEFNLIVFMFYRFKYFFWDDYIFVVARLELNFVLETKSN